MGPSKGKGTTQRGTASADRGTQQPRPIGHKLNADVLVVEDTRVGAAQLTEVLEQEGCSVRVARNGVDALELIAHKVPDILISDIVMPEMDGYELCRRIKRDPTLADTPVILVTSLSDPEDILKGLESGADNLVCKPFERAFLVSRIRQSLDNRGYEDNGAMGGVMVDFAGHEYYITARRLQIINLLLSTYATAVQKNSQLEAVNRDLVVAQKGLAAQAIELHDLSLRDELTDLHNRRGFTTLAEHELKLAVRTKTPLLLLYLDVDNMKVINDTWGHAEGDVALAELALNLRTAFREADILARVGGDEFVVLEIGVSLEAAGKSVARLEERLQRRDARKSKPYDLALSIGVAAFDPDNPIALDELIREADEAMYSRKKAKGAARGG